MYKNKHIDYIILVNSKLQNLLTSRKKKSCDKQIISFMTYWECLNMADKNKYYKCMANKFFMIIFIFL